MRREAFAISGLAVLALAGCIVADGDKACGPDQVKVSSAGARYCECAAGFVLDPKDEHRCVPCGDNEESVNGACECSAGYTRPSAGAACETSTLGAACSASEPCMGEFPLCVAASTRDEDGYCTFEGCASSDDCLAPGWLCLESVCKKPPDGYGRDCAAAADCVGSEATYCDTFSTHSCLVEGCGKGQPCPGDWSCCDLGAFAPLPICFEPKYLINGNCPVGSLVKP
jgi:hypothetical protein